MSQHGFWYIKMLGKPHTSHALTVFEWQPPEAVWMCRCKKCDRRWWASAGDYLNVPGWLMGVCEWATADRIDYDPWLGLE